MGAIICYNAEIDPANVMIAAPDRDSARRHWKTKLKPVIDSCESVASRLPPDRDLDMFMPDLGNMWIIYAWSGSPSTLSSMSVRDLHVTEINLFSTKASSEGAPVDMGRDRTKGFSNRQIFVEGKPTITGDCPISSAYDASDCRTFHLPCPHCSFYQELVPGTRDSVGGLKWSADKGDYRTARETAYYQCCNCRKRITDQDKLIMIQRGKWVAGKETRNVAGFHLNSLYSPVLTFGEYAEAWVKAWNQDSTRRQAFWNGWSALPWDLSRSKLTRDQLEAHIDAYEPNTIPMRPLAIICTADMSKSENQIDAGGTPILKVYYVIRAWTHYAESFLLRYGVLDSLNQLAVVLQETYQGPGNTHFKIGGADAHTFLDARYQTQQVYRWCASHRGTVPIMGKPRSQHAGIVSIRQAKFISGELPIWYITTDQARDELYDTRIGVKAGDPGYWSLHNAVGYDYIESLLTWTRYVEKGKVIWEPDNAEIEHYADLEAYQVAVASYYGFAFMEPQPDEQKPKKPKDPPRSFLEPGSPDVPTPQPRSGARRDGRPW